MITQAFDVRPIQEKDADRYIDFLKKIDSDSDFLLWEPGERNLDLAYHQERIRKIDPKKQLVLLAWSGDSVVGFLSALVGGTRRISHRADFSMAVLQQYQGRGIGAELLKRFENWAKGLKLSRIELTVMAHNQSAISLYTKQGFQPEGLKRGAICIQGKMIDEQVMGKRLD